jgi:PadR family transcriptional regulator PadR
MNDSERKFQKDLHSGLVALVLLGALARGGEDHYGYEIAKQLAAASEGESRFKEGTIYPVLRALAAAGLLSSRIEPSDAGPPRRYYRITPQGRTTLAEWGSIWRHTKSFVDQFVKEEET